MGKAFSFFACNNRELPLLKRQAQAARKTRTSSRSLCLRFGCLRMPQYLALRYATHCRERIVRKTDCTEVPAESGIEYQEMHSLPRIAVVVADSCVYLPRLDAMPRLEPTALLFLEVRKLSQEITAAPLSKFKVIPLPGCEVKSRQRI